MKTQREERSGAGLQGTVDELIELLHRYLRRHRELREVLRQRREAQAREDRSALEELGAVEREVLVEIGLLERERMARMARLAGALGSPSAASMRLAELVGHVECDQRDLLLELREEIRELADELDRLRGSSAVAVQTLEEEQLYLALVGREDPGGRARGATEKAR